MACTTRHVLLIIINHGSANVNLLLFLLFWWYDSGNVLRETQDVREDLAINVSAQTSRHASVEPIQNP